ncbi:MAG: hypothetical protein Q8S71_14230 [Hydrogenophaga sp.]|nr:hypothetical protein [Hydrogenophaga sp.]
MQTHTSKECIDWFIDAIRRLPSDDPVAYKTAGYNNYRTQKEHWLGWLNPAERTGTYPRREGIGHDARYVYNHIVEPKMLLWLIAVAGVTPDLVNAARAAADGVTMLPINAAAILLVVPWRLIAEALGRSSDSKET